MQTQASNRLTVLLPDERDGWHENVRLLLEPQGVETVLARSGREALDLIENSRVHLAVLDVRMPQLGGLQVIKLVRDHAAPGTLAPPAILLADQMSNQLLHEALGMHVFSVLSKPVDLNLLLDAMARVMKRHYRSRWPQEAGEK